MTMDTNTIGIIINQIAQSVVSRSAGMKWFTSLDSTTQKVVLTILCQFVHQSHPIGYEIQYAVLESGIKKGCTPCTMVLKGRIYSQLRKIVNLPDYENVNTFKLLTTLLSICDERRRSHCNGQCKHWWHKDLSSHRLIDHFCE